MHRKPAALRKAIRKLAALLLPALALAAVLATAGTASAQTVPHAHAATCRAFTRWYSATEGGYRYQAWRVHRIVRHAQAADAVLWGDVWALAQVAPIVDGVHSPEQQRAAMVLIGDAAGRVALDCSIRL